MATFADAAALAGTNREIVTSNLSTLLDHANSAYSEALNAIDALAEGIDEPSFREPDDPDRTYFFVNSAPTSAIAPPTRATVTMDTSGLPSATDLTIGEVGDAPTWEEFDPHVTIDIDGIAKPPALDLSGEPVSPEVDLSVTIPTPTYQQPVMAQLDTISIPAFPSLSLPTFSAQEPTGDLPAPSPLMSWTEPTYEPELLDEVKPVILSLLEGKGVPPDVERALLERAAAREVAVETKTVREAFTTWASRGFAMPPGMLTEQVNAAQQELALKRVTLNRDVTIKNWDLMYENLKFGVQQGLAYEGVLINLFSNMVNRTFEMQKTRVEMEVKLYDISVAIFNAKVAAYKVKADVHKTLLEAELTKLDAYKARLEAEKVRSELNTQRVQVYNAQVQAFGALVDAYKTEVQASTAKIDVAKAQIDAFRSSVAAWAEKISAQKTQYDVYTAQVQAETSKANLLNASAQAFTSSVNGYQAGISAKGKKLEADIASMEAGLKVYSQKLEAQKLVADVKLAEKKSELDIYAGTVQKYKIDSDISLGNVANEIRAIDLRLKNNIALFDARMKQYEVQLQSHFKQVELQKSSMERVAQATSAIAQGAWSAINVSAQLSTQSGTTGSVQATEN